MQHQYSIKLLTNIKMQRHNFHKLRTQLRKADTKEIEKVLSQREIVEPESELTPGIIALIKAKIKDKNN